MNKKDNNKKPKKRLNVKRLIILILFLYLIYYLISSIINMPTKNIFIEGNINVTDHEIITVGEIEKYPPFYLLNIKKLEDRIETLPLINSVKITRKLSGILKIKVVENKPLFIIKTSDMVVLNNKEEIKNNHSFMGLPTLINYVPDTIYDDFIVGFSKVKSNIIGMINYIEYKPSRNSNEEIIDDKRFLISMNDGNSIYIIPNKIDNLNYYLDILSSLSIKDKKGTLYLDSGNEDNFIFEPYGVKDEK